MAVAVAASEVTRSERLAQHLRELKIMKTLFERLMRKRKSLLKGTSTDEDEDKKGKCLGLSLVER